MKQNFCTGYKILASCKPWSLRGGGGYGITEHYKELEFNIVNIKILGVSETLTEKRIILLNWIAIDFE